MMKRPIISIIMPVFNACDTLGRAVDSFMEQSFKNWELIVVDDGSMDGSAEILDKYAASDERVHVIHKSNGGVASARQAGVELIKGEYFIHADADDWVEPNMLERMLAVAEKYNADLVIADYYTNDQCHQKKVSQKPLSLSPKDVLFQIYANELFGGLCHKLIRTSLFVKSKARFFKNIDYCEDVLFLTQVLISSENIRIAYIPEAFYHYVLTNSSLTRNMSQKSFESLQKFHQTFPIYLPDEPRFHNILKKKDLDLFITGFVNRIYTPHEISVQFSKVRRLAYKTKSLRWFLGYLCIDCRILCLAHKLIKY